MIRTSVKRRRVLPIKARISFARASIYVFLLLILGSWLYILLETNSGLGDLVSGKTWSDAARFFRQLLGLNSDGRRLI